MKKSMMLVAIASVLVLAACNKGSGAPDPTPPPPPTPSATTLASFMALLFGTTNETALPLDINGQQLNTSSEDPTQFNALII